MRPIRGSSRRDCTTLASSEGPGVLLFALPKLPESVVQANNWHFFRHFLQDAKPEYTPEEIDRYVEAWSQEGAATGMINYRSSVRQSPKAAEAALRPIPALHSSYGASAIATSAPSLAEPEHDDVPSLDRAERLPDAALGPSRRG